MQFSPAAAAPSRRGKPVARRGGRPPLLSVTPVRVREDPDLLGERTPGVAGPTGGAVAAG
jgi:hypothetical protein